MTGRSGGRAKVHPRACGGDITTSRTSSSNTLALAASAMNTHRTSSDHDDRYYTKAQVDSLVDSFGMKWMVPGDVTQATVTPPSGSVWGTQDNWSGVVSFTVDRPGRYRISGYIRARSSNEPGSVAVCIPGWSYNTLIPDNVSMPDLPPPGLGWASPAFTTSSTSEVSFTLDMLVPAAAGGAVILLARQSYVSDVSLKGVEGPPTPTRGWSHR